MLMIIINTYVFRLFRYLMRVIVTKYLKLLKKNIQTNKLLCNGHSNECYTPCNMF